MTNKYTYCAWQSLGKMLLLKKTNFGHRMLLQKETRCFLKYDTFWTETKFSVPKVQKSASVCGCIRPPDILHMQVGIINKCIFILSFYMLFYTCCHQGTLFFLSWKVYDYFSKMMTSLLLDILQQLGSVCFTGLSRMCLFPIINNGCNKNRQQWPQAADWMTSHIKKNG